MAANRIIPDQVVMDIWTEIENYEDENKLLALSQEFTSSQSGISEFIISFTETLSDDAAELAYYVGVLVWACFDRFFEGKLRDIGPAEVIEEFKLTEEKIAAIDGGQQQEDSALELNEDFPQPYLVQYMTGYVFESEEEEIISAEEEGLVFVLLLTVVNCLDTASGRVQ